MLALINFLVGVLGQGLAGGCLRRLMKESDLRQHEPHLRLLAWLVRFSELGTARSLLAQLQLLGKVSSHLQLIAFLSLFLDL